MAVNNLINSWKTHKFKVLTLVLGHSWSVLKWHCLCRVRAQSAAKDKPLPHNIAIIIACSTAPSPLILLPPILVPPSYSPPHLLPLILLPPHSTAPSSTTPHSSAPSYSPPHLLPLILLLPHSTAPRYSPPHLLPPHSTAPLTYYPPF